MSTVEAGLNLGAEILKFLSPILHPDQKSSLDKLLEEAENDVEKFKDALMAGNLTLQQLMFDGLMYGISARVAPSELEKLNNVSRPVTDYDILGFYCRARGADFAKRALEILQFSKQS